MEASAGGVFWLGFFFASGCLTAYAGCRVVAEFVKAVLRRVLFGRTE